MNIHAENVFGLISLPHSVKITAEKCVPPEPWRS